MTIYSQNEYDTLQKELDEEINKNEDLREENRELKRKNIYLSDFMNDVRELAEFGTKVQYILSKYGF